LFELLNAKLIRFEALAMAMKLSNGNLKLAASKHNGGLGRKKLFHHYVAMIF
jgi:hypothetical protein